MMETLLQRVVTLSTLEATEYERAQRIELFQPALEALKQSSAQQQQQLQAGAASTPKRPNVLLRPLAASAGAEQGTQDGAAQGMTDEAAAAAGVQPTPLLLTPGGTSLLQSPGSNAAWAAALRGSGGDATAALGLSPAVALAAGAGMRPGSAGFPHFLPPGLLTTPGLQQGRPTMRPGQQQVEGDDGKPSKKRQGHLIEPAALQKLIEKQQLEAQRKQQAREARRLQQQQQRQQQQLQQQQQQLSATGATDSVVQEATAAAAAAAAAGGSAGEAAADEPPPRQQQQQHRPRVLSRLPPQVREQAERQAAERARKKQQQQLEAAGETGEDGAGSGGSGSSRQHSAVEGGPGGAFAQQQQQLTAADCLESPDGGLGRLTDPTAAHQGLELQLDEQAKLFGSAQKRLRLSLCDEHGALLPGGAALISPVALPTPSPAVNAQQHTPVQAGAAAGGGMGDMHAPAATHMDTDTAAGAGAAGATAVGSSEAPTPSKFFSGSPVPASARPAAGSRPPETPVALVTGPTPRKEAPEAVGDPLRGEGVPPVGQGGSSSSWVPVPGQAPAVLGATPVPLAAAAPDSSKDELVLDAAAAAAMPVPESPVKQVAAGVAAAQQQGGAGSEGGLVLQTPQGQEQQVAATPVTGL